MHSQQVQQRHTARTDRPPNRPDVKSDSGPPPPKAQTFNGKNDWRPFFILFERIASRYGWDEGMKLDRLVESLRDKALDYYSTLRVADRECYARLVNKMNNRFGCRDPPAIIRPKLHSLKQLEDETLEELAERCQQLMVDGYPEGQDRIFDSLAVDFFCKAAINKDAVCQVLNQKLTDLE